MTAAALGFERPMANSLDAVSDRDFALEFLAAASICATHLSRFAEEIVIWSSAQFRFVSLSDRFSTGSSIMPQKKNPDAAELIRAKVGRITGALVALLTVMKGLPLAYSKDMQEDKEQVFDAADALMLALAAMTGMVADMAPQAERLRAAAGPGFSTATDLADWLVRRLGPAVPRGAPRHRRAGQGGRGARRRPAPTSTLAEMQAAHAGITAEVYEVLGVDNSVASRTSYGGTAPEQVRAQVARWRERAGVRALALALCARCSRSRPAGSRASPTRGSTCPSRRSRTDGPDGPFRLSRRRPPRRGRAAARDRARRSARRSTSIRRRR